MSIQYLKFHIDEKTNVRSQPALWSRRFSPQRFKNWLYQKTHRYARYLSFLGVGCLAVWVPCLFYLNVATPKYLSHFSLILPGAGSSTTVNLNNFGQASSYSNSAFANGSISPTETYKRLISADRILNAAAASERISLADFGRPKIKLVDQTNLINVEISADTGIAAQSRARALLKTFFVEIEALRQDEITQRQAGGQDAIADYVQSVRKTRLSISELRADSGLISAEQFREKVASMDSLAQRLHSLAAEISAQATLVGDLETALQVSGSVAAVTLKLFADEEYRALLTGLADTAARLNRARAQYGNRHPQRQAVQAAYDAARDAVLNRAATVTGVSRQDVAGLDRAPNGARASLLTELVRENAALEALQSEHATVTTQHGSAQEEIQRLEPVASELENRQRDFEVAEAVFASAIARSQSSKTDIYASYPLLQILQDPSLPDTPSSPRTLLVLAAGCAASMMLIIAAVLGWYRKKVINRILARPADDQA